jgi:phage virion morphogenesis protein
VAGATITITSNADQVAAELEIIAKRCGNLLPAMQIIGATVEASVIKNFQAGGRPGGWKALSPVTLAKKKGGSILIGKGFGGGLMGSISYKAENDAVMVGTNKKYAAIHQFGGQAGRGRKVSIPARPFLMVQDEDWHGIKDQLADYIMMGV